MREAGTAGQVELPEPQGSSICFGPHLSHGDWKAGSCWELKPWLPLFPHKLRKKTFLLFISPLSSPPFFIPFTIYIFALNIFQLHSSSFTILSFTPNDDVSVAAIGVTCISMSCMAICFLLSELCWGVSLQEQYVQ